MLFLGLSLAMNLQSTANGLKGLVAKGIKQSGKTKPVAIMISWASCPTPIVDSGTLGPGR